MSIYLNFPNELQAQAVLADYIPAGTKGQIGYIGHVAIQVLGLVIDGPGSYHDGWIVMLSESIPALKQYEFVPPFLIQSFASEPKVKRVPYEIARWQAKMTLIMTKDAEGVDLWTKVLALREAITDPLMQVSMDAALYDVLSWKRDSPTVNMVADNLGLTKDEVDDMFIAASKLVL